MAQYVDPNNPVLSIDKRPNSVSPASWILAAAAVVSLAFSGLFWFQTQQTNQQINTVDSTIAQQTQSKDSLQGIATQLTALNAESTNLQALFSNQKHWETVLSNIEQHLYKHLIVTSLSLSKDGTADLSGVTDTFTSYAQLDASLNDSTGQLYFTNVKPISVGKIANAGGEYAGLPSEVVAFSYSFILTPAMFTASTPQ